MFFKWLKDRGLRGVDFIVSDDHGGLTNAIDKHFQGAIWQRCQVHLMRNVLGAASKRYRTILADGMKDIFASKAEEARIKFRELANTMNRKADKAMEILENGLEDALSVMVLPKKYRRRLATSNMQERLNEEIRRRERVIRIFPNEASLIGSLLAEQHEKWITGGKYFDMEEYFEWKKEHIDLFESETKTLSVINGKSEPNEK